MRPAIAVLASFALAVAAQAGDLELDSLSFVHFPGLGYSAALPLGFSLPLAVTRKRDGIWNLRVDASQVPARAVTAPDGTAIGIAVERDPGGECWGAPPALNCRLILVLVAVPRDFSHVHRVPILFTTAQAAKSSNLVEAAREGAPLDPSSGFLQLVGTGEAPPEWGRLGGEPFLVVLSGRIDGLPAEMGQ